MNVQTKIAGGSASRTPLMIVDCDLHPLMTGKEMERRYLAPEWHEFSDLYGSFERHPFANLNPYPGIEPNISRRDAYPPEGGVPGTSLSFMQKQHLDAYDVQVGILLPLKPNLCQRNVIFGAALATAVNDWLIDVWAGPEPRLRASIVLAIDNVEASVAEIHRCGNDPRFGAIMLTTQSNEPLGSRRYWPVFAAALDYDLPLSIHTAPSAGPLMGAVGWPSYHIQKQQLPHLGMEALLLSLVMEGVFEEFPRLRVMLVEGGFSWLPMAAWRMDKIWHRFRSEIRTVKRPPSEYIRENVWISSQPMDVFDSAEDLKDTIEWIGWDKLCFSSYYPHWDFDDPNYLFPFALTTEQQRMFYGGNAIAGLRI